MKYFLGVFLFVALKGFVTPGLAADFYHWQDESDAIHFAGALADVPERYREAVAGENFGEKGNISFSVNPLTPKQNNVASLPSPAQGKGPSAKIYPPKQYTIPYEDREGTARRVIIDVTFNGRVTVPVLFDTGAPETVIFPDLAEKLVLFDQETPEIWVAVGGIGGSAPALRAILDAMSVGEFRHTFIPVTITGAMSDAFEAIIGLDFISNYGVEISPVTKSVIFEEIQADERLYGGYGETWWRTYFTEFETHQNNWRAWRDAMKKGLRTNLFRLNEKRLVEKELMISEYYLGESERLLGQLNRYANQHAVPVEWRRESRSKRQEDKK